MPTSAGPQNQEREIVLIEVNDLRPVDWASGRREPLVAGAGNECGRCGKLHAVVWTLEERPAGRRHKVGSTCARRLFEGWEPDKKILAAARAGDRERAQRAADSRLDAIARPIAEQVAELEMPAPSIVRTFIAAGKTIEVWGAGGSEVWARDGLTAERLAALRGGWESAEIAKRASETPLPAGCRVRALFRIEMRAKFFVGEIQRKNKGENYGQ